MDARFSQPRRGQKPTEAAADDHNLNLIHQGISLQSFVNVGVFNKVSELTNHFLVLIVAINAHTFIAFLTIFQRQRVWVKAQGFCLNRHRSLRLDLQGPF